MKLSGRKLGLLAVVLLPTLVAMLVFAGVRNVSAHEGRDIGPYAVELGWKVEPAFVGVPNGPEIFIARSYARSTHDTDVTPALTPA